MSNLLDCSPETVEKEWLRIRAEHKVVPPVDYTEEINALDAANTSKTSEPEHITGSEWAVEKQEILSRWISKGLDSVFNKLLKLEINVEAFDDFSKLTAEMLAKYHPNLSVFEIIAKYERELMWLYATAVLATAIVSGFRQKSLKNKVEVVEGELVNDHN